MPPNFCMVSSSSSFVPPKSIISPWPMPAIPAAPFIISKVSDNPFALPTYELTSSPADLIAVFNLPRVVIVSSNSLVSVFPSMVITCNSFVSVLTASLTELKFLTVSPTFISKFVGVPFNDTLKSLTASFAFSSSI